ncbi:MAG TPA: DciA family protein, partial [Chroococcales cyanobacterium]
VPDPIAQKSRPLFIDIEGNLVVAIKDASVGQELSLNRTEILKKLNVAGNSMGIKLRGMRFDLKRYHDSARAMEAAQTHPGARTVKEPGVSELAEIALSQSDAEQVAELRANLQSSLATDSTLATRMISMFEQELKLKIWRERQGFPRCSACKTAVQVLHGTAQYCADCFFESQSRA